MGLKTYCIEKNAFSHEYPPGPVCIFCENERLRLKLADAERRIDAERERYHALVTAIQKSYKTMLNQLPKTTEAT